MQGFVEAQGFFSTLTPFVASLPMLRPSQLLFAAYAHALAQATFSCPLFRAVTCSILDAPPSLALFKTHVLIPPPPPVRHACFHRCSAPVVPHRRATGSARTTRPPASRRSKIADGASQSCSAAPSDLKKVLLRHRPLVSWTLFCARPAG